MIKEEIAKSLIRGLICGDFNECPFLVAFHAIKRHAGCVYKTGFGWEELFSSPPRFESTISG
jgi:hypothetical protein